MFCATHHYTLFAICGYAMSMGVTNLFFMLLPTIIFNTVINLGHVVYYLIANRKALTRYPLLCSMNASQLATLSLIYAFGYFTPTIYVFQKQGSFDPTFLTQIVISNLAYDLIFTVGLSYVMLGRQSLRKMSRSLLLPIILCIVSMVLAENFDLERDETNAAIKFQIDEVSGTKSFEYRERYMHVMSRFCLAFVNIGSKVFLFKEAARQKAWSRLSEKHNSEKFEEVMEAFERKNRLALDKNDEFVPNRQRMRTVLKNSPFRKKQKELFDYFIFLTQNLYELE